MLQTQAGTFFFARGDAATLCCFRLQSYMPVLFEWKLYPGLAHCSHVLVAATPTCDHMFVTPLPASSICFAAEVQHQDISE